MSEVTILPPYQRSKASTSVAVGVTLVTPSDIITTDTEAEYMKGHGVYKEEGRHHASVAGMVQRVNKLIIVKPLKSRYTGDIGDVVVGRVVSVQRKQWRVDVNARLDAILTLANVNLPGSEQRRKSLEDELMMRDYLQEGDLVSAEVKQFGQSSGNILLLAGSLNDGKLTQGVLVKVSPSLLERPNYFQSGNIQLLARSLKYGKLTQGVLVKVSPSLLKRRKSHFHSLPCGVDLIMGVNGNIWIAPTSFAEESGGFVLNMNEVPESDRMNVARVSNCIKLLAEDRCLLYETSVQAAFDLSQGYSVKELLLPSNRMEIAKQVRAKLASDFAE